MRYFPAQPARRPAFTMVELLVVITIIAILVALVAAAVMRAVGLGPQATARAEIGQFDVALASAKTDLNDIEYLPSFIVLREDNEYGVTGLPWSSEYPRTVALLQRMFGKRIDLTPVSKGGAGHDWNGDGMINKTPGVQGDLVLQSHTALVFWLGGIPNGTAPFSCTGFSTSVTDPALAGGTRKGPYFDFKANRLRLDNSPKPNKAGLTNTGFFYYTDPYNNDQPYLYFSSLAPGNNYNVNTNANAGRIDCPLGFAGLAGINPVNGPNLLIPFLQSSKSFFNPKAHQIICAGRDGLFGDSTKYAPATGSSDPNGRDDQSNFSRDLLGAPQN
jgi:prepilin-type N-terminal cleavage/methylation domain-containing protein